MKESIENRILKGTFVILAVGILAKLSSFISETILAAYLGTSGTSDAYYMVNGVHAVVYPMLSVGIWKIFLPVYKEKLAQEKYDEADRIANKAISFFSLLSLIVVALLMIFPQAVVSIIAPGFSGETKETCVSLVRISAPMYFLIVAAAVYASMLQCHNKFLGSQIREVASFLPIIAAAVFFYNRFGIKVMAAALVISSLLRLLIELPFVDWGYRFQPDLRFHDESFALILKRLPSAFVSEGVTQINILVDKVMASVLPQGAVSALNYGHKLMNVFSGLISSAIATAMYPQMVELIALDRKKQLSELIQKIISIYTILMVPITLACILFRSELVSVAFQRGAFGAESTVAVSEIFACYSISMFFVACNTMFDNVFYGFGDTKTPMRINIINMVCNVILNIVLIILLGANGLALATSLSAAAMFGIRMKTIGNYVEYSGKQLGVLFVKISLAAVIACFIPRILFWIIELNKFFVLIISAVIGFACYYAVLKIMKVQELNELFALLKKKQ